MKKQRESKERGKKTGTSFFLLVVQVERQPPNGAKDEHSGRASHGNMFSGCFCVKTATKRKECQEILLSEELRP